MVRHRVVIQIIQTMKRRGHRAYTNIYMDDVIAEVFELLENDVSSDKDHSIVFNRRLIRTNPHATKRNFYYNSYKCSRSMCTFRYNEM